MNKKKYVLLWSIISDLQIAGSLSPGCDPKEPLIMPKRNSIRLTHTFIRKLIRPPSSGRREFFDAQEDNLCLRVSASGNRSWCVYYRLFGKNRKYTIGKYPTYSIEEARSEAAEIKKIIARNGDPVAERNYAQRKEAETNFEDDSVEVLSELFLNRYVQKHLRPSTVRDYRSHFRNDIVPAWSGRSVSSIGRPEVSMLLDIIEDRAPIQCNRVRATLSKWFNWMVERGAVEVNPVLSTPRRTTEVFRDRTLSADEIASLWRATEEMGWPFGPIFQLLLLTAKRRSEVSGMRWDEINLSEKTWTIAPERSGTKQRRRSDRALKPDVVPLSREAIKVINGLPRIGESEFVFVSRSKNDTPVSGFSQACRRAKELSGVTDWRPHDFRTNARTNLSALRVRKEIADKVLNHVDNTTDGRHYDFYDYLPEKREALQLWADHVTKVIND